MPTVEERLATLEANAQERRAEMERRFTGLETKMDRLVEMTSHHVFRATCINGSAKVLQGASAGGGVIGAAIAIVWALKQLGLI